MATLIENLEAMIGGIVEGEGADSPSEGYNFTWEADNLNTYDTSQRAVGPWADMYLEGDEPEESEGATAGMHYGEHRLLIKVGYTYDQAPENPIRQGQIDARKAYDDLIRLFARDAVSAAGSASGVRGVTRQRRLQVFAYPDNNALSPVYINSFWAAPYSIHNTNPDLGGQ